MTNQTEYLKTTLNLNFNEYFKKCIFMILKLIYTFFKGKKKRWCSLYLCCHSCFDSDHLSG